MDVRKKIFPNTDTGTGCTEQLWNLHLWRSSKFLQAKGPEEPAGLGFRLVLLCLQDSVTPELRSNLNYSVVPCVKNTVLSSRKQGETVTHIVNHH